MADTGGRRNEKPLTEEQYNEAKIYAISLGMPGERIRYDEFANTYYIGGDFDCLTIGTDVLPLGERSENPNDNISLKGTIAHEVVGHREAGLKNRDFGGARKPLDEAQASIRAARFAPGLNDRERLDLLKDGIMRLKSAGIALRPVKDQLFIKER